MILAILLPFSCLAEDGYVHGVNHCYYLNAPTGWVLDTESGKSQGVPMVFYPKGRSWANATTVIYTRNDLFSPGAKTPDERIKGKVNAVLQEFRTSGNGPDLQARLVKKIKARSGASGEIWKYTGDKWGNLELVAYFVGPNTVNFFVMSSRDSKDFERSTPALIELASSYREANDCVPCDKMNITTSCSGRAKTHR
jgi:hypothetical protein